MVYRIKQIILLLAITSIYSCTFSSGDESMSKRNITVELQDGDIAFRRGTGIVSRAVIAASSQVNYSHVGVVVQYQGEWCVVHAVPYEGESRSEDKVYCEKIEDFFTQDKAKLGSVYRLEIDSIQQSMICKYLHDHIENQTLFDHDYDLDNDDKLYCSELVWRAFLEMGIDLSQGRRTNVSLPSFSGEYIMPSDVAINDSLELIWHIQDAI